MTTALIAYDGSAGARDAIRAAAALLPGARAVVLSVPEHGGGRAAEGVAIADEAGLEATGAVGEGPTAWRAIARAAGAHDADVIVCGTRGRGGFSRALLGSTSSALLHHAERPVLVVPEGERGYGGPAVVAYDGSDGAREAVAAARRLLPGRPVVIAHAWSSPLRHSYTGKAVAAMPLPEGEELVRTFAEMMQADAQETADAGVALAGSSARAVVAEVEDAPWRTLAAVADDEDAAVLVAGSRGRGAMTSTVLGSASASLAHNATRPVLIVR